MGIAVGRAHAPRTCTTHTQHRPYSLIHHFALLPPTASHRPFVAFSLRMSAAFKYSPAKRTKPADNVDDEGYKGKRKVPEETNWVCPEDDCGAPLKKKYNKKGTSAFVTCSANVWQDPTSCGFAASLFRADPRNPHLCGVCTRDVGGYPSVGRPTEELDGGKPGAYVLL